MTQEDKEMLLKDLCARIPYGVKVEAKGLLKTIMDDYDNRYIINAYVLNGINLRDCFKTYSIDCIEKIPLFDRKGVCNIKPYLFPMSSMTEEQEAEWDDLYITPLAERMDHRHTRKEDLMLRAKAGYAAIFWLLENHFDYLGLIEKGLAIDATGKNIY